LKYREDLWREETGLHSVAGVTESRFSRFNRVPACDKWAGRQKDGQTELLHLSIALCKAVLCWRAREIDGHGSLVGTH